jgi:hypothetical protein
MSVRTCPSCGSEYLSSVDRCVDCDVELVDAPPAEEVDGDAQTVLVEGDQLTYELIGYANETKVYLDGMLTKAGVPHVWQAGDLVVRAADRTVVDELVEEASALEEPLEPDDEVVYEIVGFDEGQVSDLGAMLQAEDIEHSWDEQGDLVVRAADEDRVAAILDRIDMADELTAEEVEASGDDADDGAGDGEDGLAAQDAMSDLFVVVDKLMKDPDDEGLHTSLAAAATRLGDLGVPFGFSKGTWSDLQARASALVALTASDEGDEERDDEQIKADARALREVLHQYV